MNDIDIKKVTVAAYDKIARHFDKTHPRSLYAPEFDKLVPLIKGKKVLEIGCGTGRDAQLFVESGFDYTGMDASEGMLAVARSHVPAGIFKKGDLYKLSFPDNSFDCVWAAAVYLHVPKGEVVATLKEALRVLTPGGVGFITVKNRSGMDEGLIQQDLEGGIQRYFAFYSEKEFEKKLQEAGFEILDVSQVVEEDERRTVWFCFFVKKNEL